MSGSYQMRRKKNNADCRQKRLPNTEKLLKSIDYVEKRNNSNFDTKDVFEWQITPNPKETLGISTVKQFQFRQPGLVSCNLFSFKISIL